MEKLANCHSLHTVGVASSKLASPTIFTKPPAFIKAHIKGSARSLFCFLGLGQTKTFHQEMVLNILVLHGINLNMFGKRDPAQYGTVTLDEINTQLVAQGQALGVHVECFQTNHEGAMCERIHQAFVDGVSAVVINAGAWTHYSYGIRDALAILKCPIVEVHMSNIHAREAFRHHSVFADIVKGQICGLGAQSYVQGLQAAVKEAQASA
jgi:3-dehydroquinate dehydratase II